MNLSAAFSLFSLLASLSTIVVKSEHLRGDGGWKNQLGRRNLYLDIIPSSRIGDLTKVGEGYCADDYDNYPDYCLGPRENISFSECLEMANDVDVVGSNLLGVEYGKRCNFLYANNDVSSCPDGWALRTTNQDYMTTAEEITKADGEDDWYCYKKWEELEYEADTEGQQLGDLTLVGEGYCADDDDNYPDYCQGPVNLYTLEECLEMANDVDYVGSNLLGVEYGVRCNFLYANNSLNQCPMGWEINTSNQDYMTTAEEITKGDGEDNWYCYKTMSPADFVAVGYANNAPAEDINHGY